MANWFNGHRGAEQRERTEVLLTLAERVAVTVSRHEAFLAVAQVGAKVCEVDNCHVLLLDSAGEQLRYVASSGDLPRHPNPMSGISGPVTCYRARETTEALDPKNCPFLDQDIVNARRQISLLYEPIESGGVCLGVVEFERLSGKRGFSREARMAAGHVASIAAHALRLSDQRAMQEQMHRNEKMAAVTELAGVMSQELTGPFEEIARLSGHIPRSATGRDLERRLLEVNEMLGRAERALDRLTRFVSPHSGSLEDVDLNALLRSLAADQISREENPVKVKLALSKRPITVSADPTHLRQVFEILARHAEHFLVGEAGAYLQIHTASQARSALISIAPMSGSGGGLGSASANWESQLGLTMCQGLIERAGGSLRFDRGSGAGFRIDVEYPLPESDWRGVQASEAAPTEFSRIGRTTVLVIEPNKRAQQELVRQLTDHSYRAVPVSTAAEALELANRMEFDWVFCDLQLPTLDGLQMYERLHDQVEQFVFLADQRSAAANPEIFESVTRQVLRKPFTPEDVEALLDQLLRASATLHGV